MGAGIRLEGINYAYGPRSIALDGIDLEVSLGEVVVITGPSGSGKSTITRVINGLVPHFYGGSLRGRATINDVSLEDIPSCERGRIVGNVFQDPRSQFFANEVAGEIAFGCENYGLPHAKIRQRVHGAASKMDIEDLLDRNLHALSYGMRQKVAIASAAAVEPDIYLMDEPSANLDALSTYRLADIIRRLKASGKTVVIVEHRLFYLMDIADRFICIDRGRVAATYTARQMDALADIDVLSRGLRSPNLGRLRIKRPHAYDRGVTALDVRGLCVSLDGHDILRDIDITCWEKEVTAVIGPNGAGKSTLGKALAGLVRSSRGTVALYGRVLRARQRLGQIWYIAQDLDSQLFGEDLVDELTIGSPLTPERMQRARSLLRSLDLSAYADRHPSTLSGGQKQRLALGIALMHDAPILILDEPTSGLDGASMRQVSGMIRELAAQGKSILLITHDAECALSCCNRAIRLEGGRLTDDFTLDRTRPLLEKIGYTFA